ncbi:Hypothetical radical SAM family enzyme in heat shock gene cluster, similarity with CPO of BS HemN-type [hydrothermal vent metagenome]|uniref:Hypothetical radical SAM family enzyme in heat shock gene cluster, similarity with CPO of BS HemN-type n=1 Tax=hydrothermal vent metagenome TaxID=652676 RepID=A0A3B1DX22_9ZZZZ
MHSLYIHIPFCKRKCFYCSFSISVGQEAKIDLYLDCLEREAILYKGKKIKTIYFGGGTPSLLTINQLKKLCKIVKKNFIFKRGAEWTIEINPDGIDENKVDVLKFFGVNRFSLGAQSLNDEYLKYLGRTHTAALVKEKFLLLKNKNIQNVSLDLMYGFPNQTMEELKKDVEAIVKLGADHLSLYSLDLEKGSRFYAKEIPMLDEQKQVKQYTSVLKQLQHAGFMQYEISNFSRAKKESQHNICYWNGGNYIGLGVSAHSHIDGRRFWNVSKMAEYIKRSQSIKCLVEGEEILSVQQQLVEVILFGLRMNRGVCISKEEKRFGCLLNEQQKELIEEAIKKGLFSQEEGVLKTGLQGRLVLDEFSARFV